MLDKIWELQSIFVDLENTEKWKEICGVCLFFCAIVVTKALIYTKVAFEIVHTLCLLLSLPRSWPEAICFLERTNMFDAANLQAPQPFPGVINLSGLRGAIDWYTRTMRRI